MLVRLFKIYTHVNIERYDKPLKDMKTVVDRNTLYFRFLPFREKT